MNDNESAYDLQTRILQLENELTAKAERETDLLRSIEDLRDALATEAAQKQQLGLQNQELAHLTVTDWLTGLYNHRFMIERCEFEIQRSTRYGHPLSCVMLDIDHFKRVNDTYGHQFGDAVLRQLGQFLMEISRSVDISGRYGGEEFMILVSLPVQETFNFMSRFHREVENRTFYHHGKSTRITVSIGIAEFNSNVRTCNELIERADKALYRAKQDGRNLLRIYTEQIEKTGSDIDHCSIEELRTQCMELSRQMKSTYVESTNALLKAVDARDNYTLRHSRNVADIAARIASAMNLPEAEIEVIKNAGLLHDIGKIGIEEKLLIKNSPLTAEEYCIMKKHAIIGVNILRDVRFLQKEIPIILHHHERFDGTGYPQGLQEREIPIGARILAVADAYDAMNADRQFREKMSWQDICRDLRQGCGSQFDPNVVEVFLTMMETEGTEI